MLPVPLILVIVACGTVVTGMIIESCYVAIQNVRNKMKRKQPPLSTCDENMLNKNNII